MRKIVIYLFISFLASLLIISNTTFSATRGIRVTFKQGESLYLYKDYHALVVGISNYEKWPRLPNAVNDAKEVASRLKELGFEVKLALDQTSREMKTAISEMVYKMGREENRGILFYYAGHGETETLADKTKMGYIIPKDCPLLEKDPIGFATHAISMRDIESASMRIRCKHVIMLFDSCFSGSLFALVRAVPDDITEKSALPVRQFITAGREDEQVPDKSMFKRCFLLGLDGDADLTGDGYITGSELGMYLSDKVVNYTHRRQHPQYGKINNPDLDRGDFIFVASKARQKDDEEKKKLQKKLEAKLKDLEVKRMNVEDKLLKVDIERKVLGEELKRVKAETQKVANTIRELEGGQIKKMPSTIREKRLAYSPKEVKDVKIHKVKLRSAPKNVWESDIERMIDKYNFFVKLLNESGNFPNDFVDNGDGTITDRATGLMWEKGGSSSILDYGEAKEYAPQLNKEKFLGYNDWRIPTVEELSSLLESMINQKGLYINNLFKANQTVCWSSDLTFNVASTDGTIDNYVVDFATGSIPLKIANSGTVLSCVPAALDRCYIKAVRTIK